MFLLLQFILEELIGGYQITEVAILLDFARVAATQTYKRSFSFLVILFVKKKHC